MDWTQADLSQGLSWIKLRIGKTVALSAGSQKNQWWSFSKQAVIKRLDTISGSETVIQFGFFDDSEFVAQLGNANLAISQRREGIDEAFSFEPLDKDLRVEISTNAELLRDTSSN